jgi:drug/metabolite transporter (DMT)-like permease
VHRLKNWQLLAVCVLTWGTTWYAITFQVGEVAPEVAVALRFGVAGFVVLVLCALRGERLAFGLRSHAILALQGGFMYGLSYLCVYHAEQHVVSALVAVGYSASPLVSGLGARWLFGTPLKPRFVAGGLLGLTGVALIFAPEIDRAAASGSPGTALLGAAFTVASVLLSAVGSLTASRNRSQGLPFWPALGIGMLYGAATSAGAGVLGGVAFVLPAAPVWWLALAYLAVAGSVLTFACFLTLQQRIGPGPAGTVGVITPLIALVVSMLFERFEPSLITLFGAALAVLGNVWLLGRPAQSTAPARA